MTGESPKFMWTIAGSDNSAMAGIQCDVLAAAAFGIHACTVVTATTAQGLSSFEESSVASAAHIASQCAALLSSFAPRAVKVGMLGNAEAARAVAEQLARLDAFCVLDTPLSSSSGGALADEGVLALYRTKLLQRADLITPNVPELEQLTERKISADFSIERAARHLLELGAKRVLVKGGHLAEGDARSSAATQDYYCDGERSYWLSAPYVPLACRGTGCALSAAIASCIARGDGVHEAIVVARAYVQRGIRRARPLQKDAPHAFFHEAWPVEALDYPAITDGEPTQSARLFFPSTGQVPLGFYPIVDSAVWIERLAPLGVTTIQLRIKARAGEELAREVARAIATARRHGVRLFVNDHWPLAMKLGAYGVHLGQEDMLTADLAAIARSGLRLGLSTHSYEELARATAVRPSYIALGPIFPTSAKAMRFDPQGLQKIKEWRRLIDCPLVAIGGIRLDDAAAVWAHGADGISVISDVRDAQDPERHVLAWMQKLASMPWR